MVVNRMRDIGCSSGSVRFGCRGPCRDSLDGRSTRRDADSIPAERAGQEALVLFGVLGVVEARPFPASPPIDLGSPLQRVLLGLLLTEADRSVSFDRIVQELWGDAPPADPEASLHTYVSRLRRALEPSRAAGEPPRLLLRTPAGYRLAVSAADVDAGRFADRAAA